MDKKIVCNDLFELGRLQGVHTGRWENEYDREDSCEDYLSEMISIAKNCEIEYDEELENYRESDNEKTYEIQDHMAYEISEKIKKHFINQLIEEEN